MTLRCARLLSIVLKAISCLLKCTLGALSTYRRPERRFGDPLSSFHQDRRDIPDTTQEAVSVLCLHPLSLVL